MNIGDGITINNNIISVPEYSGATASAPGTSGLMPPAAAGEQDLFLTGGGDYKPALTKLTDSVTSSASDTAASAKAVKAAYDRGSAGITAAGTAQAAANNALNVANGKAPGGYGLGVSSTFDTVSDLNAAVKNGWYSTRPATANIPESNGYGVCLVACCDDNTIYQIHFGTNVWIRKISNREQTYGVWRSVWNVSTGDARYAALALAAQRLRNTAGQEMTFAWNGQGGQPTWVWGGNDGVNMFVYNPSNFNVNYANIAGSLSGMKITNQWTDRVNAPAGGTWYWINVNADYLVNIGGPVAGGSVVAMGSYSRSTLWIPS